MQIPMSQLLCKDDHNYQIRGTGTSGYSSVGIASNPSSQIQPALQTVSLPGGIPDASSTTIENEELPTRVPTRKRKERKRGPPLTLCLDNCKYDVGTIFIKHLLLYVM